MNDMYRLCRPKALGKYFLDGNCGHILKCFMVTNLNNKRNFSEEISKSLDKEKFVRKTVRIAVLGAASTTGKALALLLKQNPLFSNLYLYDRRTTLPLATDLNHLDTRCAVSPFSDKDTHLAVRNADIIVALGLETLKEESTDQMIMMNEGKRLTEFATTAALHAPKAIFVDCIQPLSVTLPVVSEIYRKNHWYHPGRVIGSVALLQMRLNTLLANHLEMDPAVVQVPLLGGPDDNTILPLFSRATPKPVSLPESNVLVNRFRNLDDEAEPTDKSNIQPTFCPYGNAFAINRLVTTVALGLLGDSKAIATAYIRSNFVNTCRHLVTTVKFGKDGVVHNYGVPRLTKFELKLFERVTLDLRKKEDFAKEYNDLSLYADKLDPDRAYDGEKDPLYFPPCVKYLNPSSLRD